MKMAILLCLLCSNLRGLAEDPSAFELRVAADWAKPGYVDFAKAGLMELPRAAALQRETDSPTVVVKKKVLMDGSALKSVETRSGRRGWEIVVTLTDARARQFAEATTNHVNERMALVVRGEVIYTPNINQPITGGVFVMSWNLGEDEANAIAKRLQEAIVKKAPAE